MQRTAVFDFGFHTQHSAPVLRKPDHPVRGQGPTRSCQPPQVKLVVQELPPRSTLPCILYQAASLVHYIWLGFYLLESDTHQYQVVVTSDPSACLASWDSVCCWTKTFSTTAQALDLDNGVVL